MRLCWIVLAGMFTAIGLLAGCPVGSTGDPNQGDSNSVDPNNSDPNSGGSNAVQPGDLVDFLHAEIAVRAADGYELQVSGTQPNANVQIVLSPVTYVMQPDYWRIEVRAAALPSGSPPIAVGEFNVSLELMGYIGKMGIEVAGATTSRRFDLPAYP